MSIVKNKQLSSNDFVFAENVERFFKNYTVNESIEFYKFFYADDGSGTSCVDLSNILYHEDLIIWNVTDSLINNLGYDSYNNRTLKTISQLEKICLKYPNKKFLLLTPQFNVNNLVTVKNLAAVNIINTVVKKNSRAKCLEKQIGKKNWICLNSSAEPHRIFLLSYIIKKKFDLRGLLTASNDFSSLRENSNKIKNLFNLEKKELKEIIQSFKFLKNKNFQHLRINPYNHNNIENYKQHLFPIYQQTALEIIPESLFFETTPIFSEKFIQSVYALNFPIIIAPPRSVDALKNQCGIDVFDDIIDHSYDFIDDPAKRIKAAIDLNSSLLDGSRDLNQLWHQHRQRLINNCDVVDSLLTDTDYQYSYDERNIKHGLDQLNIRYERNLK